MKTPIAYAGGRASSCIAVVSTLDGEPLAEVDMTSGDGRLTVGWPCRVDLVTIGGGLSGMPSQCDTYYTCPRPAECAAASRCTGEDETMG